MSKDNIVNDDYLCLHDVDLIGEMASQKGCWASRTRNGEREIVVVL